MLHRVKSLADDFARRWLSLPASCRVPVVAGLLLLSLPASPVLAYSSSAEPEWWIDRGQLYIGGSLAKAGGAVDSFLSRDYRRSENHSYLRIRLARVLEEGGSSLTRHDFDLHADLPKTRKRLRLVISSESDDFDSLLDQERNEATGKNRSGDDEDRLAAALRFFWPDVSSWNPSLDIGIRSSLPLDPFVKFRVDKVFALDDKWYFRTAHELFFYHQSGLGEKSAFVFDRRIGEDWLFASLLEMRWEERETILEFAEILSLTHFHRPNKTYVYRSGAFFQRQPRSQLTGYFVDINYRRRLYQEILFAEMIPGMYWLRENDFKGRASITFRLVMYFRS